MDHGIHALSMAGARHARFDQSTRVDALA